MDTASWFSEIYLRCMWCFLYGHLTVACFYSHPFLCLSNSLLRGIFVLRAFHEVEQIMPSNILSRVVVIEKRIHEGQSSLIRCCILPTPLGHNENGRPQWEWAAGPGWERDCWPKVNWQLILIRITTAAISPFIADVTVPTRIMENSWRNVSWKRRRRKEEVVGGPSGVMEPSLMW